MVANKHHYLRGVLLILVFAVGHTLFGWRMAEQGLGLGSDQLNIGVMSLRLLNADLFTRDYVFANTDFFAFYTPAILSLIGWLAQQTGNHATAFSLLLLPTILLYTAGMWLFLGQFTRHRWLALFVALASAYAAETLGGTVWGVARLRLMIPRSLLLCLLPWFCWLWWQWRHSNTWWQQPLLGLLLGIGANLHPVSGLMFAQLFLIAVVWFNRAGWRTSRFWFVLALTVAALLIGVWPTARTYVINIRLGEAAATGEDFARFRQVMQFSFSTLFPFNSTRLQQWVGPNGQILLVISQALVLITAAWAWWRQWLSPRRRFALLLLVQLPLCLFITDASSLALLGFTAVFGLLLLYRSDKMVRLADVDHFALLLLTSVCTLTMVGSFALEWVWNRFNWWALTTLVGEQARMAKFIYLPLYLFAIRLLTILYQELGEEQREAQVLLAGLALALTLHRPVSLLILLVIILIYRLLCRRPHAPWRWPIIGLLCICAVAGLGYDYPLSSTFLFAMLAAITVTVSISLWCSPPRRRGSSLAVFITAVGLTGLVYHVPFGLPGMHETLNPARYQMAQIQHQEQLDEQDLYAWARANSPREAIFYTDAFAMRFFGQRAITHSTKDWGTAYYRRDGLVAIAERWLALRSAYAEAEQLLREAEAVGADYIYIQKDVALRLDRPVLYSNNTFIVYAVQP